MQLYIYDIAVM